LSRDAKDLPLSDTYKPDWQSSGLITCLLLVAFTAASILFMQSWETVNSDVAFLTWTAGQVMGPPVFGVDVYEVNPPLAFMIYAPAAFFAPWLGYDLAVKLWVTAMACASVAMFWQTCDAKLRLPLTITLALFVAFVLPGTFGQREQIAFMLTAPYVAGPCRNRGGAIISGVMAGVGFAIKPHFLIALVLVFATRRKISTEEVAIAATGAAYAVSLVLFFQPYLFEFMPLARATYWAAHMETSSTWKIGGFILLSAVPFSLAGAPQPSARGFIAATFGFTIAALIQYKGFSYHFLAAWGFLALFLLARTFNARRLVAVCAVINLLILVYIIGRFTLDFTRPTESQKTMARLLPEIDRSPSFLSFAIGPFPAFPTALYTASDYKGLAIWPIFISAAREPLAGPELQEKARQLTFGQARRELERKPDLVIVERKDTASGWSRAEFDLLAFLETDAGFRALWNDYSYDKTIGKYELYRRR